MLDECLCVKEDEVRYVFVTSQAYNGSVPGGPPDKVCEDAAAVDSGKLPSGKYRAWVNGVGGYPAGQLGFTKWPGRYVKLNPGPDLSYQAIVVANSWDALVLGPLRAAINVTEEGKWANASSRAWTGLSHSGEPHALEYPSFPNCAVWSNKNGDDDGVCEKIHNYGIWGEVNSLDESWSWRRAKFCGEDTCCLGLGDAKSLKDSECDHEYHFYCFQQ
jgi:hypothetical protein